MSARFCFVDHVGSKKLPMGLSSPKCQGSIRKRHTWSRTSPRLYLYISCLLVILSAATGSIIHDQSAGTSGLPWAVKSITDSVVSTSDLTERKSKSLDSSNSTAILECFQVTQPVLSTSEENCTVLLMSYSFANSYGAPFVGTYTPPACSFDRVIMNMTVTSRGRQFDRLALMYFNDTEVFRASTAEPTLAGIQWTYIKDMTEYMYFWKRSQRLIFDLGNIQDSTYTGAFNVTLTATFLSSSTSEKDPADMIIPISARLGSQHKASVFMLPSVNASNTITLPRNVNRAIFSISACGQAAEEFWWSNTLSGDISTFPDTTLYGYSPFREVSVLIDGYLAGVQWPFPVIFTGGVVPGLWRPLVGIDAFDLREREIDITPFLGYLCDGKPHTFEMRVAGIADDSTLTITVGASWYLTGKIFLWLDDESSITTGSLPTVSTPSPTISISHATSQNTTGSNETLTETTAVNRNITISSTLQTQHHNFTSSWSQSLSYTNKAQITAYGQISINEFMSSGIDTSSGLTPYESSYEYPLYCNQSYIILPNTKNSNFTLSAVVNRGLSLKTKGSLVSSNGAETFANRNGISSLSASQLSDTVLVTTQNGSATYISYDTASGGTVSFGSTSQRFRFEADGGGVELYKSDVEAVNGSVVYDKEVLMGVEGNAYVGVQSDEVAMMGTPESLKALTGKGEGSSLVVLIQADGV